MEIPSLIYNGIVTRILNCYLKNARACCFLSPTTLLYSRAITRMPFQMLTLRHHSQVLYAVIASVPIVVVHVTPSDTSSPQHISHQPAMVSVSNPQPQCWICCDRFVRSGSDPSPSPLAPPPHHHRTTFSGNPFVTLNSHPPLDQHRVSAILCQSELPSCVFCFVC